MSESEYKSPVDVYKQIIDNLVKHSESIHARSILETQIYNKAKGFESLNEFLETLTHENCKALAEMLNYERRSAIHDVLSELTWWLTSQDVELQYRGQRMPIELSGMGLHGDYIGRLDNWSWPDSEKGS